MKSVRLLIADDDPIFLRALRSLFLKREGIDLVAAVADGAQALRVVETQEVDVALLDVDMPTLDGISAAKQIAASHPDVTVVMFTAFEQENSLRRALEVGAKGFLTKDLPIDRLADLIRQAHYGATIIDPRPTEILVDSFRRQPEQQKEDPELKKALDALPRRLAEVLDLLIEATPNKDIAEKLGLSDRTARVYVSQLLQATGCKSRSEVAVRALGQGYQPKARRVPPT